MSTRENYLADIKLMKYSFFFSSRRRHTRLQGDWSSDVCSSDLRFRDLFSFHLRSAIFGVIIFALGWLYKKFGPHPWHEGFPGYFFFLTSLPITSSEEHTS